MQIKTKLWIEDDNANLIFGSGKTEILHYIQQYGSIKEAAGKTGMNYKKAWNHIQILQKYIDDELVITAKGRTNGGTTLTPKAKELIRRYRQLKEETDAFVQKRFEALFYEGGKEVLKASDET
ncbi:MAG: winged helix-turn-helix domain-containing protein [Campylobacterota bacterium]